MECPIGTNKSSLRKLWAPGTKKKKRINDERGLLQKIFGTRKTPEPEQWSEKHDEMALAFLTPQEKAQYRNEGYTREDILAYAKDLITDTAEKTRQTRSFNRDPVHGMMVILKDRASLRGMKEDDWSMTGITAGVLHKDAGNVRGPHIAKSARMNRVKKMMRECKTGRDCLAFLNNKKCKVMLEPTDKRFEVFPEKGKIVISPSVPDEETALLLVRGAVAVMNWRNYGEIDKALHEHHVYYCSSDGPYQYISTKEKYEAANVMTQQARFAHEMKDKNPNIRKAFCEYGADVYQAFDKGLETKKDVYQAMTDAFLKNIDRDLEAVSDAYSKTFAGKSFYKKFEPKNALRNGLARNGNGR